VAGARKKTTTASSTALTGASRPPSSVARRVEQARGRAGEKRLQKELKDVFDDV